MAKAIARAAKEKQSFRLCVDEFLSLRRQLIELDIRAAFLKSKHVNTGKLRFVFEQASYLDKHKTKRMAGRDHTVFYSPVKRQGPTRPFFLNIERLNFQKRWSCKPKRPVTTSAPLSIQKKNKNSFVVYHSRSRDVPKILRYLEKLWDNILCEPDQKKVVALLSEFEWWFFAANPAGRCGASLGDALSIVLQIRKKLPLRNRFEHLDWEALSRPLEDYIEWRSQRTVSTHEA
jgi:hypothetical protein